MNNEEENKEFDAVCWIVLTFTAILLALVFKKVPDDLFWPAIVAEGLLALAFYGVLMSIDPKQQNTEQKVYYITPDQSRREQEQAELRAAREASAKEREIQERIKKAIDNL